MPARSNQGQPKPGSTHSMGRFLSSATLIPAPPAYSQAVGKRPEVGPTLPVGRPAVNLTGRLTPPENTCPSKIVTCKRQFSLLTLPPAMMGIANAAQVTDSIARSDLS